MLCLVVFLAAAQTLIGAVSDPVITSQPQDGIAKAGEDFTFSVTAFSTNALTYQWSFNGGVLAGRTNSDLVLTNLTTAQSGSYSVLVQTRVSFVKSVDALLTVQGDPFITSQPQNGIAGLGEDFVFSVTAVSTNTLTYRWQLNGGLLLGQTNSTLVLSNLTTAQAGVYSVLVQTPVNSVVSSNALLTVQFPLGRRLQNGRVIQVGTQAGVPINMRANGRENAVSFSLGYTTNAFSNPTFVSGFGSASVSVDLTVPGVIGVAMALPPGNTFPVGNYSLGLVQFDLAPGAGPLDGGLLFATNPIPISAINPNGLALSIFALIQPQMVIATVDPELDFQSGFFVQQVFLSNPGAETMTNIDLLAVELGIDKRSNSVTFANAQSDFLGYPYQDPLLNVFCDCDCGFYLDVPPVNCDFPSYLACGTNSCSVDFLGITPRFPFVQFNNLPPGQSVQLTTEFLVADHETIPHPTYAAFPAEPLVLVLPVPTAVLYVTPRAVLTNGVLKGVLLEFPTSLAARYYIEYATNLEDLATIPLSSFPPVTGTGSRVQWIDSGPPNTVSSPFVGGTRFYRVLQGL